MKWNARRSPEENASKLLPSARRKYWKASEKLLRKHLDFEALHKFRLRTKRYRYTLELFRDIDSTIDAELQKLKPMQDLLGEINDCATALELIGATSGKHPRFAQYLHERAAKKTAKLSGLIAASQHPELPETEILQI